MVRGQFSGLGNSGNPASLPQQLVAYLPSVRFLSQLGADQPNAATTFEKTLVIWLPMTRRITITSTDTRMRMTTKPPAKPSARPMLEPEPVVAAARAGTQAWPSQRHSRSCENAGLHSAPSHHQKPAAAKRAS